MQWVSERRDLLPAPSDLLDFKKNKKERKNAMTSDAAMARRNFIFSSDILTTGRESDGGARGNLHNFQAHKT